MFADVRTSSQRKGIDFWVSLGKLGLHLTKAWENNAEALLAIVSR
jgi:hypothetical protein